MTFEEVGTLEVEDQGPFSPEQLAGRVYSRGFYSADKREAVTVSVAAVISDNGETYYPLAIIEIAKGETDPESVTGDDSTYEYDPDISYVDFDTPERAAKSAHNWIKNLEASDFS